MVTRLHDTYHLSAEGVEHLGKLGPCQWGTGGIAAGYADAAFKLAGWVAVL
jgi:hypothetical protein